MGREFELKYRATPEQIAAIKDKFGGFTPISMETFYYDTNDRSLRNLRWTLRRRMENSRSVCTLKTPLPDGSRGEWETEADTIEASIMALCELGAPKQLLLLTQRELVCTCGARFTRLAATVQQEAVTVELALDRGVLLGGGQELSFAEVEVELKGGSQPAAIAFARQLAEEFSLTPEPRSKIQRALDLANL